MDVRDRVIVITGGGGGIGAALARRFHAEGAHHVAIADLDGEAAGAVAGDVGGSAHGLDAADQEAITHMVETVTAAHGPVDLFCANAGIATGADAFADPAAWQRTWDVNVMSQVYAARAVVPDMVARGEGYLLLTASAAGLTTSFDSAPYAVTKHASVALAEWLAITYRDQGVGVSCLAPQFVDTPLGHLAGGSSSAAAAWAQSIMITPEEVATSVIEGLADERFLILPHPEVARFFQNKAGDYDRWLAGMRKLRAGMEE